jgi:hypothetical protein
VDGAADAELENDNRALDEKEAMMEYDRVTLVVAEGHTVFDAEGEGVPLLDMEGESEGEEEAKYEGDGRVDKVTDTEAVEESEAATETVKQVVGESVARAVLVSVARGVALFELREDGEGARDEEGLKEGDKESKGVADG